METLVPASLGAGGRTAERQVAAADDEVEFVSSLRLAVLRMSRRMRSEQGQATVAQLSALSTLYRCGPLTPTMLAVLEHVQPPSMTRVIALLQLRGLVSRKRHPKDRRQALIELTGDGRRLVELDAQGADESLAAAFERLTPDEQRALRDALPAIERLAAD